MSRYEAGLPGPVAAHGISKNYDRDTILHHQDEVQRHICYVRTGRAFAVSTNIDGDETWVTEYTAGQFIGSDGLFERGPTAYYIIAKTPLTGVLFSIDSFINLMNEHPALNNMVTADMAYQLSKFTVQTLEANSLSVRGRIASELKRLARPIGKTPDTFIIRPTPVFSELAQRLGSSRETVSRTVSSLVKKNIVERRTGALVIPDLELLDDQIK